MFVDSCGVSFEDLLRDFVTELFCDVDIHVGIVGKHRQSAVPGSGGELKIGGAFRGCVGAKCMAHIVGSTLGNIGLFEGSGPRFLDVDAAESCFAGEDKGFLMVALCAEALKFFDDGIAEGDAARAAIFGLFDVGEFVFEVDVSPLEIENFTLEGSRGQGEENDAIEVGGFAFS